jgi:hypothetical protein
VFEMSGQRDIDLLIEAFEAPITAGSGGNPHLFRKMAASGLVKAAKESDCRRTVEEIACTLARHEFREELAVVRVKLGRMPLPCEDRKSAPPLSRPPERASGAPQRTSGAPQGIKIK